MHPAALAVHRRNATPSLAVPARGVAGVAVGVLATAAITLGVLRSPTLGLAALIVVVAATIFIATQGLARFTHVIAFLAFGFAPLIAVRVTANITVSDVLLIIAFAFAVLTPGLRDRTLPKQLHRAALAVAVIAVGGLVGNVAAYGDKSGVEQIGQYVLSAAVTLGFVAAFRPTRQALRWYALAYALGSITSHLDGLLFDTSARVRSAGLSLQSNHLAIGAVIASGALLGLWISAPSRVMRTVAGAGWILLVVGVIHSGSRAGVIGMAAVLLAVVIGVPTTKFLRGITITAGVAIIAVSSGLISLGGRTSAIGRLFGNSTAQVSDSERLVNISNTAARLYNSPFLGSGFVEARQADSIYLSLWDSAGLLGVIGVILLVTAALSGWRTSMRRRDALGVGLWAGYIGYLVAAAVSNQLWDRYLWLGFAMATMALMTEPDIRVSKAQTHMTVRSQPKVRMG